MTRCLLFLSFAVLAIVPSIYSKKEGVDENIGTVVGIDLGTTYSCVGVFKHGRVEIIANDQGNRITPSYVAFTAEGERLIGDAAKNQLTSNPENTVFDAKRLIGREWTEKTVQHDVKFFPFTGILHEVYTLFILIFSFIVQFSKRMVNPTSRLTPSKVKSSLHQKK